MASSARLLDIIDVSMESCKHFCVNGDKARKNYSNNFYLFHLFPIIFHFLFENKNSDIAV